MENFIPDRSVSCRLFLVLSFLLFSNQLLAQEKKTITFKAKDGLVITADMYVPHPNDAPFIILFHQAGWSRGEYIEIAPKLNKIGFNCMAVDQRSGAKVNNIINQTHAKALVAAKLTNYLDARADMEAAIDYVKAKYKKAKLIIWGSSYSASLVLKLASQRADTIDGVLAFSPGEYFSKYGKSKTYIRDSAKKIKCPVFITSARNESKKWKEIFDAIPSKTKASFVPLTKGNHGSRALWKKHDDSKDYWQAVSGFLHKHYGEKKKKDQIK